MTEGNGVIIIKEELTNILNESLKAKDVIKVSVIRLLKSAIKNAEIDKRRELADDEIYGLISSAIKQRRESITEFQKGKRQDLVDKETSELKILEKFLPPQLSKEEITKLINDAVKDVSAIGPRDIGKVMSAIMPKVRGKADGTEVNRLVREILK